MEGCAASGRAQRAAARPVLASTRACARRRVLRSVPPHVSLQRPQGAGWLHARGDRSPSRTLVQAVAAAVTTEAPTNADAPDRASERDQRLEVLVELRKLYRNLLRAETLLQQPSPVYQGPPHDQAADAQAAAASSNGAAPAASSSALPDGGGESACGQGGLSPAAAAAAQEKEEQQRVAEAVEVVAEMQLTAEEMNAGIRALRAAPVRWGSVFDPGAGSPEQVESLITSRVRDVCQALYERAAEELLLLPFPSDLAAQAALDIRNAKYRLQDRERAETASAWPPAEHWHSVDEADSAGTEKRGLGERLEAAERVAEAFVARKLQPAVARVRRTSPQGVVQGIKSSAVWARDLWTRLNGGGVSGVSDVPQGLPVPLSTDEACRKRIAALNVETEALEGKLQEASKARENRLRKAGIQARARFAAELRGMDSDVAALSKALAVRTLELEMEYIYVCLEDEALDIVGDPIGDKKLALNRRGSSDEVALLVAEFRLLDEQLSALSTAAESAAEASGGRAEPSVLVAASGSSSDVDVELAERGVAYIDDAELARLAVEIPDLRVRLGIPETQVFGGTGFSLVKLQMQVQEGVTKVVDGVLFGVRGIKLLFTDIGSMGRLFWRAVNGGTLKPREVAALRRTVRDLLAFVPFAIILIIPMTPVGHVLVFGFIQRYFPGFFPSQFTSRRQELMMKYEELKTKLKLAQLRAEAENDEIEFKKAAAAAAAELKQRDQKLAAEKLAAALAAAAAAAAAVPASSSAGGSVAQRQQQQRGKPHQKAGYESEEEEGPAQRAVRKIEEQLAEAADQSYCEDELSAGE